MGLIPYSFVVKLSPVLLYIRVTSLATIKQKDEYRMLRITTEIIFVEGFRYFPEDGGRR